MNPVEWADDARDQLADIWVAATPAERERIEPDVLRLEKEIVADPFAVGESRFGLTRVDIRGLLVVWFNVSADGSRARVIRVTRPARG